MPNLQGALDTLGTGQQQGPLFNVDLSNHPLKQWLSDPTFQQWFSENFPDEQFPPAPNRMGDLWHEYTQAGGQIPSINIKGYNAQDMMKGYRFDKGQANEFNTAWSDAFGGNPPGKANAKSSGFKFKPFGRSPGRIVRNVAREVGKAGPLVGAGLGGVLGGPVGALAGAGIGGALGGALGGGGGLGGSKERVDRFSLLTPKQEQATNQLLTEGMRNTQWGPIEQQAREDFATKTIPSLAERFEAMGGGQQRSSAFAPAMASAGGQLERQLAGLKSQYGMQQLGMGLQPRAFENVFRPSQPGLGQQVASGAAQFLPYLLAKGIGL